MTDLEKESFEQFIKQILNNNSNIEKDELLALPEVVEALNNGDKKIKKSIISLIYKSIPRIVLNYSKRSKRTTITTLTRELDSMRNTSIQINNRLVSLQFDGNIVKLNKNNSDYIEEKIKNDTNYVPFAKVIFDSFGSQNVQANVNNALFAVLRGIDIDNSTNVWRFQSHQAFIDLTNYMADPNNNVFPLIQSGDKNLPDKLTERFKAFGGGDIKSFASKICKYLSVWCFNNYDNYYINDTVVRHSLLYYLDYYSGNTNPRDYIDRNGVTKSISSSSGVDNLNYYELEQLLSRLHLLVQSKEHVTLDKDKFDHIMWYSYKSFSMY